MGNPYSFTDLSEAEFMDLTNLESSREIDEAYQKRLLQGTPGEVTERLMRFMLKKHRGAFSTGHGPKGEIFVHVVTLSSDTFERMPIEMQACGRVFGIPTMVFPDIEGVRMVFHKGLSVNLEQLKERTKPGYMRDEELLSKFMPGNSMGLRDWLKLYHCLELPEPSSG